METQASINIGAGTRLLLRLWKDPDEAAAVGEENWQSLLAACDYHRVSPLVFHRLRTSGAPADVLEELRARFYRVSAYNHRLAVHLVQLISRFKNEQIPALVLKGPAAAVAAYGDLSLRQYEDIDLLIPVEHVSNAVGLLRDGGFHPIHGHSERYKDVRRYHEITMSAPDNSYAVDLHWQLSPPYACEFGPDVSLLWSRAMTLRLPQGDVPAACPEDLFLALCQHGTRHRWSQLKWLFDIAELLRHPHKMDWSSIETFLKNRPLARQSASLAATLARELLGSPVPPQAARMLEPARRTRAVGSTIRDEFLSRGQTNGSAHDTLLGLEQRALVRARYMAIEAIQYPAKNILFTITAKDLQFVRLPQGLRIFYYIIRPLRLVVQHGRVAARRIWSMAR